MVELDAFLPRVLRYAPNCADPLAYTSIRDAAREACERGLIWQERDKITIAAGDETIYTSFADASIVKIENARINGYKLEPVSPRFLDEKFIDWQDDFSIENAPQYITQLKPNEIALYPRQTGQLSVRLTLKPSITATELPDFLLEQFSEEIGKGAASAVLLTNNEAVASYELGVSLKAEFNNWLDALNVKAAKGQQDVPLRTKSSWF